jgi:hypothetical protein
VSEKERVKSLVRAAFAQVEYPGDWCLRCSNEGTEPFLLEAEFAGKNDWQSLDPQFLDQAPDGFATALSFFSDEAFHFYLPAYLLADLDGRLVHSNPVFHLTHGLDESTKDVRVNPRRYGERTWWECARYQFAVFNQEQAEAITAYLKYKRQAGELVEQEERQIDEALGNYWSGRAAGRRHAAG